MQFVPKAPSHDGNINAPPGSPLAEAAKLLLGIAVAGLVVLTLLFAFSDFIAVRVPVAVEVSTFHRALDQLGNPRDARSDDIERVLRELYEAAPVTGYTHRVAIVPGASNAFAVIGGVILLTEGLLDEVETENDLAFVLAHELGHFAARDQMRGVSRMLVTQLVFRMVFGGAYGGDAPALVSGMTRLESLRHSREQESAADRYALELLAQRYGHIAGASRFFERASKRDGDDDADNANDWVSTHPLSKGRIRAMRDLAARRGWPQMGEERALPSSFKQADREAP